MFFSIISHCGGGQDETLSRWKDKEKTIREQEQKDGRGRQKMGQAAPTELWSFSLLLVTSFAREAKQAKV